MSTLDPRFPSSAVDALYDQFRFAWGARSLHPYRLFEVTGSDRRTWLQGQITQDIRRLAAGGSIRACLCTPTGQMVADLALWDLGDSIFLSVERDCAAAVVHRFESMVILEDVEIRERGDLGSGLTVQGAESSHILSEFLALPPLDAGWSQSVLCLRHDRTGDGGWDLYAPEDQNLHRLALASGPAEQIEEVWSILTLESGRPLWGQDATAKTLPPEMGPDFAASRISYTKGCYTGQEVLHRIYSRGHTNKTWVALVAEAPLEAGQSVHLGDREVGVVTRTAVSPEFGPIAGAMLRNEATTAGSMVQVGGIEAEVRAMPLFTALAP